MTKRATVIATIVLTLVVIAWIKSPTQGQDNLSQLFEWLRPW